MGPFALEITASNFALWRVIASGSSLPRLAPLPPRGDAGGITDVDPDAAGAGLVSAIDPLRHDALCAQPASVCEDDRAVLGDVVQPDAAPGVAQQLRRRGLSVQEFGAPSDDASRRQQRDGPAMVRACRGIAARPGRGAVALGGDADSS
jgi:hypothetical protein